jgi:hypothetical protein
VRIAPGKRLFVRVTRYITMFSTEYFEIVGSGNSAFTPNANNAFYAAVAPADSGCPRDGHPEGSVADRHAGCGIP